MSSSGLIYAVIVGAWAAYLVPMWLRRQDELNEARPTERFSTAIRLLSGKAAMERRYAKEAERREAAAPEADGGLADGFGVPVGPVGVPVSGSDDATESAPDAAEDAVDVRAFADPRTMVGGPAPAPPTEILRSEVLRPAAHGRADQEPHAGGEAEAISYEGDSGTPHAPEPSHSHTPAQQARARRNTKRAKVLARRRRTTMVLFVAFTLGALVAAVGGLAYFWAPLIPGALLSGYIVHLRVKERRRFAVTMDRRRAEAAAQRLHEHRPRSRRQHHANAASGAEEDAGGQVVQPEAELEMPEEDSGAADRRALVEQTDHAEWVDQQRGARETSEGGGWDPMPVPLPTYVNAPVAPRNPGAVDFDAPDTWSSARSTTADDQPPSPPHGPAPDQDPSAGAVGAPGSGPRRGRTPLFDQYEEEDRPRAANE